MPKIETYQKRAKLLVRWHRARNYSVGEKVRLLVRFRHLSDAEVLTRPLPLTVAQEIVAVEAGFTSWATLKAAIEGTPRASKAAALPVRVTGVVPIVFVCDVAAAAEFYRSNLGFQIDFLHGKPPFYAAVSRDLACLHLRFVHRPNFAELAARESSLILASFEVANVKELFAEYEARDVKLVQRLTRQAWGGLDFQVEDLDGNRISFVEYSPAITG